MDSTRIRECLAALGWSPRDLAAFLGINETTPRNWTRARATIPDSVANWLEATVAGPVGWDKPVGMDKPDGPA